LERSPENFIKLLLFFAAHPYSCGRIGSRLSLVVRNV
jgi:hypothetical protein